ncbi:uncharacterized protein LOC109823335 [Asparagus officinalis]|uniref:uncharacterized protein LOC109823335 n=1 Tax=Asparagus officinalis TaxID=4686 RepID=UPI00098DFA87|nr:uncharacterized protein LOC109823335 [Asparagus officinalis]
MRKIPDKSWIDIPRSERFRDQHYRDGCEAFMKYAEMNPKNLSNGAMYCPCYRCKNMKLKNKDEIRSHLANSGFYEEYKYWSYHGEGRTEDEVPDVHVDTSHGVRIDDTDINLQSDIRPDHTEYDINNDNEDDIIVDVQDAHAPEDLDRIMKLLEDSEKDLYKGCTEYSRFSFMLELLHIKSLSGMENTHFEMLLDLLRKVVPGGERSIPKTTYAEKQIVSDLGLDYNKIDACPNDCILYYKDNKDLQEFPTCGVSRWKQQTRSSTRQPTESMSQQSMILAKVLRHFLLVSRLQRLYMNKDTAKNMRWHKEDRIEDGKLRHPADAEAWNHIDKTFPNFAHECRNVRLGLSSDGFNLFGVMSSGWSTWPVVLMPYNLPPLLCMKQPYMILLLLIPGKHAPGNDIDVYLEPLIDELKQLWSEGMLIYDAHAKESFRLRAILMWNLSGWSTKGKFACPVCGPEFEGLHLHYSRKCCYWFNRRWLPSGHKYRKWSNKFDGTVETRNKPRQMTGAYIVKLLEHLPKIRFGKNRYSKYDSLKVRGSGKKKKTLKRKRAFQRAHVDNGVDKLPKGWSKFSIFFQLPYWQKLKIRHNLDVMHIEKNICDNIVSTLLQDPNKSKDDLRARQDIAALNIQEDLQAQDVGLKKKHKPSSHVTMSTEQM